MKVFINPGHAPNGVPDPGAEGNGYRESDIAWEIGTRLQQYLLNIGYEAPILQHDELAVITDTANASNADLFVSIHMNGFKSPFANGCEVWSGGSVKADSLADNVLGQLLKTTGFVNRGVKNGNLYVTQYTNMPAILVEVGFITSPSDCGFVVMNYDEISAAIARGITDYRSR